MPHALTFDLTDHPKMLQIGLGFVWSTEQKL